MSKQTPDKFIINKIVYPILQESTKRFMLSDFAKNNKYCVVDTDVKMNNYITIKEFTLIFKVLQIEPNKYINLTRDSAASHSIKYEIIIDLTQYIESSLMNSEHGIKLIIDSFISDTVLKLMIQLESKLKVSVLDSLISIVPIKSDRLIHKMHKSFVSTFISKFNEKTISNKIWNEDWQYGNYKLVLHNAPNNKIYPHYDTNYNRPIGEIFVVKIYHIVQGLIKILYIQLKFNWSKDQIDQELFTKIYGELNLLNDHLSNRSCAKNNKYCFEQRMCISRSEYLSLMSIINDKLFELVGNDIYSREWQIDIKSAHFAEAIKVNKIRFYITVKSKASYANIKDYEFKIEAFQNLDVALNRIFKDNPEIVKLENNIVENKALWATVSELRHCIKSNIDDLEKQIRDLY